MVLNNLQQAIAEWILNCFNKEIANDTKERNFRFLEEALELVQANGATKSEALELVDYVFGRPVGDLDNEIGGVMVTLASLCNCINHDFIASFWREYNRINQPEVIAKIRAKQLTKPRNSALPGNGDFVDLVEFFEVGAIDLIKKERKRQIEEEGFTPEHDDEHTAGQLADAAALYAMNNETVDYIDQHWGHDMHLHFWPFELNWLKKDETCENEARIRDLVRSGAMIVAEIERLQREERRK